MGVRIGEPLGGAYPLLYERIATDRSAHGIHRGARSGRVVQGSITYVLEHS
jgi:hypothetical protein